jgi:hypothetical protein
MDYLLCNKDEFMYFEDYIRSLQLNISLILYDQNTTPFTENKHYMCIRRIPFNIMPKECKISFINTEQLSVPAKFIEYQNYAIDGVDVYDYSMENIKISKKGTYLPYRERPEEVNKLKEYLSQKKEFDFAVLGSPSSYRFGLINILCKRGFKICYIQGWNDARDKQVGKCRALLNLHFNGEYSVYEPIRCERWRFAGMPIYSEKCSDDVPEGITIIHNFETFTPDR